VFLVFHQFGDEGFRDSDSVLVDQNSGFAVKPNDEEVPWADMDDHDERARYVIGRQEAISAGAGTMAMLILLHDLGFKGTIL
jgi:hypothetical protein